jgi:2-hydroxy-6-oxonona-2,4-dienedioate hydrolase
MKTGRVRTQIFRLVLLVLVAGGTLYAQKPAEKQVQVYGQRIRYLEAGAGPTVILVHGLGGYADQWSATIPALAPKYHVYAPDQVGFGASDKPQMNYSVATLVDFLGGFYKELGITRATLVGNSLGGWEALAFALAHPEKVDRIVLVDNAGYSIRDANGALMNRDRFLFLNPGTLEGTRALLGLLFYNKAAITDAVVARAFTERLHRGDSATVNALLDSFARGEDFLDGKLGGIRAPTLVLWGREDALIPLAAAQAYAKDIAGAKLAVLDACGHIPQVECPAPFNAALLEFLGAAPAAGSH